MCCCSKPNVNGTPNGYSWDGKSHTTRAPAPPALRDGDEVLYDEPGRCGGLDCHAHHFQLVKTYGGHDVLVRHGGGDVRFSLGVVGRLLVPSFASLDSNGRYWLMHTLYSTREDAVRSAEDVVASRWRVAAANKRIKTRKVRGTGRVKVWIEPAASLEVA
jgi:hypothetical protein